jgi:hypothetical protein
VCLQEGLPLAPVCQVLRVHPCEVDGNVEDCIIGQLLASMALLWVLLATERTRTKDRCTDNCYGPYGL